MDNFEKLIKQKVEQFEPKFNEAHWNALDQKLTTLKRIRIIKTSVISTLSAVAVAVGVYFASNNQPKNNNQTITNVNTEKSGIALEQTSKSTNKTITTEKSILKSTTHTEKEISHENKISNSEESPQNTTTLSQIIQNNPQNPVKEIQKNQSTDSQEVLAQFSVSENKVCVGQEIQFYTQTEGNTLAYVWDFGDGNYSNKMNPKISYKNAGTYNSTLTVTNKRTGIESKSSQTIIVLPLPNTDFSYSEISLQFDDNKLKYPQTVFSCKGEPTDTYEWNFMGTKTSNEKQPAIIFEKAGDYLVTLTSKGKNDCKNSATKTITIQNTFELFAPSAFTPNFDGNNDNFLPEAISTWDIKFEMIVKNKSGNVVYKTTDKNSPWNGSLNNSGNILEEGIYFWQVITYDVEGKPFQHVGKLTLMK